LQSDINMIETPGPDTFAALSDPTRRQIVERLAEGGAQRISDLSSGFAMSRQAVTKHLDILEKAGIVTTERRGRERLNRLAEGAFDPVHDWLARYDRFWESKLGQLKKLIEEGKTR
jgi:DNA-binding transcriptional ArsR family regulator